MEKKHVKERGASEDRKRRKRAEDRHGAHNFKNQRDRGSKGAEPVARKNSNGGAHAERASSRAVQGKAAQRRSHRKRRGILHSRFYQVYFLLVLLSVAGIVLGARHIGGLLEDYEAAQPKHAAESVAALFERADYATICGLDTSMRDVPAEDRDYYVQNLRALAAGRKVTWAEAYTRSADERLYRVSLDGEKFAEFTLVPSGLKSPQGNRLWTLGSITTYVTVSEPEPVATPEPTPVPVACGITVPDGFTVRVNGEVLGPENVAEEGIPTASAGMLPEGIVSPTLTRYAFYTDGGAPEISVTGADGSAQLVAQDGEHIWSCPLPQSPELKAMYEESVVEVAKRIAKYSARDLKQSSVLKYCAKNSPAYESIRNLDPSLGKVPKSSSFENVVTSDYYQYGESCFSCRVSFDYIPVFGKESKTYPTAYTLYFIREGDSGRLYSFTLG